MAPRPNSLVSTRTCSRAGLEGVLEAASPTLKTFLPSSVERGGELVEGKRTYSKPCSEALLRELVDQEHGKACVATT